MNLGMVTGAMLLAVGWLIPNHQVPWTSFHNEAWVATVLFAFSWVTLFRLKGTQPWTYTAIFVASMSAIPLIQFLTGQVKLAGTAWMASLYLAGFCLAILSGLKWGNNRQNELPDMLFFSIACAATVSVGVQLCQWLKLSSGCFCSNIWVFIEGGDQRPSANLGQPNQLGTLLIWGVLAYGWAWTRKAVSAGPAILGVFFLLFGLALTGSRTGALSLGLITFCVWRWRLFWSTNATARVVIALFFCYLVLLFLLPILGRFLVLDYTSSLVVRTTGETRLDIWLMFWRAIWQQPWFGYGWDQTAWAQVALSTVIPASLLHTGTTFAQAHNLFLDLLLWMGIPLGAVAVAAIAYWVVGKVKSVKTSSNALLILFVLTALLHAMLELPLYYAYLLMPFGLLVGVIGARFNEPKVFVTNKQTIFAVLSLLTLLFVFVIHDYFLAEESYNELLLERSHVLSKVARKPPDVVLLTQLRDIIIFARYQPSPPVAAEKLIWVEHVALTYPTNQNLLKLATALALAGRTSEALAWLERICEVSSKVQCSASQASWKKLQSDFSQLETVSWPKSATR